MYISDSGVHSTDIIISVSHCYEMKRPSFSRVSFFMIVSHCFISSEGLGFIMEQDLKQGLPTNFISVVRYPKQNDSLLSPLTSQGSNSAQNGTGQANIHSFPLSICNT